MEIQEELRQIELEVANKTKDALQFLQSLYPISYDFMTKNEKSYIDTIRKEIEELHNRNIELFYKIPLEDRNKYKYTNILANFNSMERSMNGLEMVGPYSDEYDLHSAFSRAYGFATGALEDIVKAEKNNDSETIEKSNRILKACDNVFDAHFWGESYKDKIQKYNNRLRTGRTIDDDLTDYYNLVNETKLLAVEYAKAIKQGITEQEKEKYFYEFKAIFAKEQEILMFTPRNMIEDYVNLHWLKVGAENNPDKVIEENELNQNKI